MIALRFYQFTEPSTQLSTAMRTLLHRQRQNTTAFHHGSVKGRLARQQVAPGQGVNRSNERQATLTTMATINMLRAMRGVLTSLPDTA